MTTIALTVYILMWPVGVAAVLCVISRGFFREWAEARAIQTRHKTVTDAMRAVRALRRREQLR
ncbi:putative transporter small subunit, partial [Streptomyces diastaticus]|uniref:putative transporter small subunit n=1 Tax=Streptomyces diastaticus TaxID=1956 RepID=UPI0036690CB4